MPTERHGRVRKLTHPSLLQQRMKIVSSRHTASHYGPKRRMGRVLFQALWEAVRRNCHTLHGA